MQFPIQIAFKILTLAPKLYVTEAGGRSIGFVRKKLFAFRESVTVYDNEAQSTELYHINADRIIDFNANYHLTRQGGETIGYVRRRGARSLWKAHYETHLGDQMILEIGEENALVRLVDLLIGEIPIIGMFTGYFLNPVYNVTRPDGTKALRIVKQRSFLESTFTIEQQGPVAPDEQECALLGIMMMVLLERARG